MFKIKAEMGIAKLKWYIFSGFISNKQRPSTDE